MTRALAAGVALAAPIPSEPTVTVERLLAEHEDAVRRFLAARCGDADLAADLFQETALRLVRAAGRLDPRRNLKSYLFHVAAGVWRDEATATPADARLLERELLGAVRRAVESLPAPQREVLELRQREGLTFREIAARLA